MKIALGCDHVGYELKAAVLERLAERGCEVVDFGCQGTDRVNYPQYAKLAAKAVAGGQCDLGMLLCGTGVGISIAANKVRGIRAVVCSEPYSAAMARKHNDANMLAMGSRVVGPALASMILDHFLDAAFEGGRHQARVDMIAALEDER